MQTFRPHSFDSFILLNVFNDNTAVKTGCSGTAQRQDSFYGCLSVSY